MHLPFNEGFIRVLATNYPMHKILFAANGEHVENLNGRLTDIDNVSFYPILQMKYLTKGSLHNPIFGTLAARKAIKTCERLAKDHVVESFCFLGFNSFLLLKLMKLCKHETEIDINLILHNDLSANFDWRSKNPFIKAFDLRTSLTLNMPNNLNIVVLELGIRESLLEIYPNLKKNIKLLEHPILSSDCNAGKPFDQTNIKIGFVGHCSKNKGFNTFLDIAKRYQSNVVTFYAIGQKESGSSDDNFDALERTPSLSSVPRDEYVKLVADMDIICLPVSTGYNFVASGSVLDAISNSKPVFILNNNSYRAMQDKYGEVGILFDSKENMIETFSSAIAKVSLNIELWQKNIQSIKLARTAENIEFSLNSR